MGGRATWLPPDHELAVKTRGRCEARSPPRLCGDRAPPRHPLQKAHFSYFLAAGPAQATETFVPSSLVLPPRCGLRTVHRGGERAPGLTPRLRLGGPPACPALSRVRQGRCVPGGLEGNGAYYVLGTVRRFPCVFRLEVRKQERDRHTREPGAWDTGGGVEP